MRTGLWALGAVALVAIVGIVVPSILIQQQVAATLRTRLDATGPVAVRVWTTLPAMLRGRVERIDVDARGVRLGDLPADRLAAQLRGVTVQRAPDRQSAIISARAGNAAIEVTQENLERYLRDRGVANPSVKIDEAGISATGNLMTTGAATTVRVRGQFQVVGGTALVFRVTSLEVAGVSVPQPMADTVLALAVRPITPLRDLPVPLTIDRLTYQPGRVVLHARTEAATVP